MANKPKLFYQHALRMLLTMGLVSFKTSQLQAIVGEIVAFTALDSNKTRERLLYWEQNADIYPWVHTIPVGNALLRNKFLLDTSLPAFYEYERLVLDSTDLSVAYKQIESLAGKYLGYLEPVHLGETYATMSRILSNYYGAYTKLHVYPNMHLSRDDNKIELYDDFKYWAISDGTRLIDMQTYKRYDLGTIRDSQIFHLLKNLWARWVDAVKVIAKERNNAYVVMHYNGYRYVFDKDLKPMYPSHKSWLHQTPALMLQNMFDNPDALYDNIDVLLGMQIHDVGIYTQLPASARFDNLVPIVSFTGDMDNAYKVEGWLLDSRSRDTQSGFIPMLASRPDELANHQSVHTIARDGNGIETYMAWAQACTVYSTRTCTGCGSVLYIEYKGSHGAINDGLETLAQFSNSYNIQDTHRYLGEHYCHECYENRRNEYTGIVSIQGAWVSKGFEHYIDTNHSYDLTCCVHEHDFKPNRFKFSYTQADVDAVDVDNPRMLYLGTEIEIDGFDRRDDYASAIINTMTKGKRLAYAMRDGSLNDGFEIGVMPATLDYHMHEMDYANGFDTAVRIGFRAHETETCGLHVHINRSFLGDTKTEQNYRSALMALILERNWDDVVKFARRDYSHIERWADKQDLGADVYQTDTHEQLGNKMKRKYGKDKYVAINMQHNQSVEIRIFRGTLKVDTYLATLQFVSNLAHYVMQADLSSAQRTTLQDIFNFKQYHELATYAVERRLA